MNLSFCSRADCKAERDHLKANLAAIFEQAVELHENPHPLMPYRDALSYRLGTTGHAYDVINTTEAVRRMDKLEAALHEIATRPVVERNPDGDDQAAYTMQMIAQEALKG